jgi:hypothetical protein
VEWDNLSGWEDVFLLCETQDNIDEELRPDETLVINAINDEAAQLFSTLVEVDEAGRKKCPTASSYSTLCERLSSLKDLNSYLGTELMKTNANCFREAIMIVQEKISSDSECAVEMIKGKDFTEKLDGLLGKLKESVVLCDSKLKDEFPSSVWGQHYEGRMSDLTNVTNDAIECFHRLLGLEQFPKCEPQLAILDNVVAYLPGRIENLVAQRDGCLTKLEKDISTLHLSVGDSLQKLEFDTLADNILKLTCAMKVQQSSSDFQIKRAPLAELDKIPLVELFNSNIERQLNQWRILEKKLYDIDGSIAQSLSHNRFEHADDAATEGMPGSQEQIIETSFGFVSCICSRAEHDYDSLSKDLHTLSTAVKHLTMLEEISFASKAGGDDAAEDLILPAQLTGRLREEYDAFVLTAQGQMALVLRAAQDEIINSIAMQQSLQDPVSANANGEHGIVNLLQQAEWMFLHLEEHLDSSSVEESRKVLGKYLPGASVAGEEKFVVKARTHFMLEVHRQVSMSCEGIKTDLVRGALMAGDTQAARREHVESMAGRLKVLMSFKEQFSQLGGVTTTPIAPDLGRLSDSLCVPNEQSEEFSLAMPTSMTRKSSREEPVFKNLVSRINDAITFARSELCERAKSFVERGTAFLEAGSSPEQDDASLTGWKEANDDLDRLVACSATMTPTAKDMCFISTNFFLEEAQLLGNALDALLVTKLDGPDDAGNVYMISVLSASIHCIFLQGNSLR